MLGLREIEGTNIVEVEVDGRVSDDEPHGAIARFEASIGAHGTIRLIEIIRSLPSMESARA
jgi:hypothetical protein